MKAENRVFAAVTVFLVGATVVYALWADDPTGTTALLLSSLLSGMLWYYLWFVGRRLAGPRPEDRDDAEVADGAETLGFYSPYSWWPLIAGFAAATTTMGLIFGWWLTIIGAAALVYGTLGFLFEYYKKEPSAH